MSCAALAIAAGSSLAADSTPGTATANSVPDPERQELLIVRKDEGEAVIALNEAIATAQEIRRAETYLASPAGSSRIADFESRTTQFEQRLQQLEDRFTTLYQAHFGAWEGGNARATRKARLALRPEATALKTDAARRKEERAKLIQEYRQAQADAAKLRQDTHDTLAALQKKAPRFEPTPAFTNKPSATIQADGTPTGILFGNAAGGLYCSARINPAIAALGLDYEVAGYDPYSGGEAFANQTGGESWKVQLEKAGALGLQSTVIVPCAVHRNMANPSHLWEKWLAEPNKDANMPVFSPSGVRRGWKGHQFFPMDFYHPAVRGMMGEYLTEAGRRYNGNPRVLWFVTAWEARASEPEGGGSWGQWPVDVRTPAGLKDFRRSLQQKFGTIESLNVAWKSKYETFDKIEFPPDLTSGPQPELAKLESQLFPGRCGALYYEYNRWLKDSYADWLAFCRKTLKAADPTHPVAVSPAFGPIDSYLCIGYDAFQWAEKTCDVYAHQVTGPMQEVFLYSIKRLTGRTTANNECIWNEPEYVNDMPEEVVRAAAVRNLWRQIAWGRSALTLYGPNDTYGGGSYDNFMVFESEYQLLRRSGGAIETTRRRLRSMEDVWLNAPVVEPRIALLKPSTSQICQQAWQLNESVMQNLHENLYRRNYHYAYVPEEYILSGKDDLAKYTVLLLPWATHFPPGLTEKLLAWVKNGGTLICSGMAGAYTPYGEEDGTLAKELFGVTDAQVWYDEGLGNDWSWAWNVSGLKPGVQSLDEHTYGHTLLASYGKGRALMVHRLKDLNVGGPATPHLERLLDQAAPRRAWTEGAPMEMVLREKGHQLDVVLINPNPLHPARATIHLADGYRSAVDRGVERGFPVPLRKTDRGQAFDITLAPGAGTVLVLTR
ncbi:MAG: beta-galactosidase trimerization domain-containing protein [Verrucomicrobiae bacterium]|nr:beta-galactosidase trimerization domain-containing protein [Verrucomicrobiae bacterium]